MWCMSFIRRPGGSDNARMSMTHWSFSAKAVLAEPAELAPGLRAECAKVKKLHGLFSSM